jgi:hypothetical protein
LFLADFVLVLIQVNLAAVLAQPWSLHRLGPLIGLASHLVLQRGFLADRLEFELRVEQEKLLEDFVRKFFDELGEQVPTEEFLRLKGLNVGPKTDHTKALVVHNQSAQPEKLQGHKVLRLRFVRILYLDVLSDRLVGELRHQTC